MTRVAALLERLPLGTLVRRAAVLGSGAAIGQAAVVVAMPLLARLYTPAEFGVLAVFLAVSGVAIIASTLRYEQAILVAADDDEASAVAKAASWCVLGAMFVTLLAGQLGEAALARFTSTPEIDGLLWVLPLTVGAGGAHQVMLAWATRTGAFGALSRSKIVFGVAYAGAQLAFGALSVGPEGLVYGVGLSFVAACAALAPAMGGFRRHTAVTTRDVMRRYRHFPQFGMWASLLNRAALEVPAVGLAALYGPEAAGAFVLAMRVVAAPTRLVTESAYQVYVNEAARLQRSDPGRLRPLLVRTVTRLFRFAVPAALVLVVVGPWGFGLVFGSRWTASADTVRLLAPLLVAMFVTQPVAGTLWIRQRLDLQLMREIVRVALVVLAFLVAWWFGLGAAAATLSYVAAMVVGYALLLGLCYSVLAESPRPRVETVTP